MAQTRTKYICLFKTEAEYAVAVAKGLPLPHVSYCEDSGRVRYQNTYTSNNHYITSDGSVYVTADRKMYVCAN